jgi:hypothetical protein
MVDKVMEVFVSDTKNYYRLFIPTQIDGYCQPLASGFHPHAPHKPSQTAASLTFGKVAYGTNASHNLDLFLK